MIAMILCAGKGTRMNDDSTNKVCFEVAGVPVINRVVSAFRKAGVENFVIVVGHQCQKVMECLKNEPGIAYAYQSNQNGTGSAALCGLSVIKSMGYNGDVIISAGDKIIDSEVIENIIKQKKQNTIGMVCGAQLREFNQNGGRFVISEDNKVFGIVESTDSALMALGKEQDSSNFLKILNKFNLGEKKNQTIIKTAMSLETIPSSIVLNGKIFTSEDIEKTQYINGSLYCFDINLAWEAIKSVNSQNAQNEFYITDMVNYFAEHSTIEVYPITKFEQMMTYSTKEELKELNTHFLFKDLYDVDYWLAHTHELKRKLSEIYGDNTESKYKEVEKLLKTHADHFGIDSKIILSRAPGRVNLMGRHVEHRGGCTNVMCTDDETLFAVSPRHDNIVSIKNVDSNFKDYEFSISECMKDSNIFDSWVNFIESPTVSAEVTKNNGAWVNYVKAAIMRFCYEYKKFNPVGMNITMSGTIPVAAGLSSSSSIVVATAEALVFLNHLNIEDSKFVDLCGEGEWLVGTRGGSGDQAAMKKGCFGKITHMNFKPFSVGEAVDFSSDYRIVVADSQVRAKKSEGAKDKFNQKVACYEFGLMLIKKYYPNLAEKLEFLRDINRIGLSDAEVYEILLTLPEKATTDDLLEMLPEKAEEIKHLQTSHKVPEYYEVRSVMLYGITECLRSEKATEVIKNGNYRELGNMMHISHNGDRVQQNGKPYNYSVSDEKLKKLISNLKNNIDVENSKLINQSGGYACSVKEIDDIVDIAESCEGVLGAQISGAGLGGSVIILVKKDYSENLLNTINEKYYKKNNLLLSAKIYGAMAGSSVVVL